MSNLQTYKPNLAIHPGKTLSENLDYLHIAQSDSIQCDYLPEAYSRSE